MSWKGGKSNSGAPRSSNLQPIQGNDPPPLFPPISIPQPLNISSKDRYMLEKNASLKGKIRKSPYYLIPKASNKDIERYSDRYLPKVDSGALMKLINPQSGLYPQDLTTNNIKPTVRKLEHIIAQIEEKSGKKRKAEPSSKDEKGKKRATKEKTKPKKDKKTNSREQPVQDKLQETKEKAPPKPEVSLLSLDRLLLLEKKETNTKPEEKEEEDKEEEEEKEDIDEDEDENDYTMTHLDDDNDDEGLDGDDGDEDAF